MATDSVIPADGLGMPLSGARRSAFNQLNERIYSGRYHLVSVPECFCGSGQFRGISRFDRFGLPFGTKICQVCGLVTLDRMLSESDWESFYNDIYWALIAGSTTPSFQTAQDDFADFKEFVRPYIDDDVRTVMEVGCGSGVRLELIRGEARRDNIRIVGSDYSEEALRIAGAKGIEVFRGGVEVLKAIGQADVLILSHVFEHLPDLRQAMKDISELTHAKTKIYVEVPGIIDLENKREYGFDYQDYSVLAHVHNFSLTTLANVFRAGGFGLIRGNEYVRAMFSKSCVEPQQVSSRPYEDTMEALQRAHVHAVKHRHSIFRRIRRALAAAKDELCAP